MRFVICLLLFSVIFLSVCDPVRADFQAGAAVVDVTPKKLPVLVNGGMTSRSIDQVHTPVNARSLAISDGEKKIVIVVVDSCMMPRPLLDESKKIASEKTGIPIDNILISATHTHSAPSCMGALGTDADPAYVLFLKKKLIDAVIAPLINLEPARVGYGKIDAGDYTALRRWVIRPGMVQEDPFGNLTVRANMHAASNWEQVTGETGPEDPELSLISLQSRGGRPIAVLANFSMHYFGDAALGADYFGLYAEGLKKRIQTKESEGKPDFVGMMSHGCSGDIWRRDYAQLPEERNDKLSIDDYTKQLLDLTMKAYREVSYTVPDRIGMAESRMTLDYRVPDQQRLEWAKKVVEGMGDRLPKTKPEVYAREQLILHEKKRTEIVVQALHIGEKIAITTTPNETYAITGLKVKAASPFPDTMVIELANGGDGYIPPPEQHLLGGYNTWAARSAGLEVDAEPKITETSIQLLEKISGVSRRPFQSSGGVREKEVLALNPIAYWRLDEFQGPRAVDSSENHLDAFYEPRVLFYLDGPQGGGFASEGNKNRAAHFAGHRLSARLPDLGSDYAISLWFWNGMPNSGRDETGWIFSRGRDHALGDEGDHLGIGGSSGHTGNLVFFHGKEGEGNQLVGKSVVERWTWNHLYFSRSGNRVEIYLNGAQEAVGESKQAIPADLDQIFFGGRCDNQNNFEGRLDEITVFQSALTVDAIDSLSKNQ